MWSRCNTRHPNRSPAPVATSCPSASCAAQFQAALGRHFAERGNARLADAARTKARTLYEEKLAKEPENSAWAAELAELLLIHSRAKKSAGGVAQQNDLCGWAGRTRRTGSI